VRNPMDDGDVVVRSFRTDDVRALHDAVSESIDDVAPYETWCHAGYAEEEAAEYVGWWIDARTRGIAFYYAVEDARTGLLLGAAGLSDYSSEHKHAMLGYWIRSSRTRQGIGTHAAALVCRAGFEDLGLIRIGIMVPASNRASRRVAEKLGAIQEGVLRRKLVLPAGPADVIAYGLLPEELAV
jgi:ribosomal-protein-serine acetyltransferase